MGEESGLYPAGQVVDQEVWKEPVSPMRENKVEIQAAAKRGGSGLGKEEEEERARKAQRNGEEGAEGDQKKGEKALQREDKREYHRAVNEERNREDDGRKRESGVTGGASGSRDAPEEAAEPEEETKEEDEADEAYAKAKLAKGLGQPREPSAAEVATHRLAHLPYEGWCPICIAS